MNPSHRTEAQERPARDVLRVFWDISRPHAAKIGVVFAVGACAELAQNVVAPLCYKSFINTVAQAGSDAIQAFPRLVQIIAVIAGLQIGAAIFMTIRQRLNITVASSVMSRLRVSAYRKLLRQSQQYFADSFTGALVHRINDLANSFEAFSDMLIGSIWGLLFSTVGALIVVFSRDILIGTLILLWVILTIIANYFFAMWRLKYDLERAAKNSIAGGVLSDGITNALNIKTFATVAPETARFERAEQDFRKIQRYTWETNRLSDLYRNISLVVLQVFVLGLAVWKWSLGLLTVGDVVLFQSYILAFQGKVSNLGWVIRVIFTSIADAKEGVEILNRPFDVRDARNAKSLNVTNGAIEFQRIVFNYAPSRKILDDLSLQIASREKVAFVGASGAGKSTIVKLLLRFYDVNKGSILIDSQNISKVTQDSLHHAIAFVSQEPLLFHRSLKENIGYGRQDATDEEIIEAAKKAHCHEFISALPQGYDTLVGERGIKLSGGERQRVAIARAIVKDAPILILDEATSSLDSESEALIQDALRTLMKDKTVIVIAHRLSTIMQMDRIIVMDGGTIVDAGTHDELLKKDGIYQKLWSIQAGGFLQEVAGS